jgi:translation elongation factor EF-4
LTADYGPSVEYQVTTTDGREIVVDNPADLPPPQEMVSWEPDTSLS